MCRFAIFALMCVSTMCWAQNDLRSCLAGLAGDPRFASLSGKVSLGDATSMSSAMLEDRSIANRNEREAIGNWAAARSECVKVASREGNEIYRPPLLAYNIEAENKVMAALTELYDGKISFGQFSQRRQAIAEELRDKSAALNRRIQDQRTAEEQSARQAREAEHTQKELQELERQTLLAQQQAQEANERHIPWRRIEPYALRAPAYSGVRPYRDCFRFGNRIVCNPR